MKFHVGDTVVVLSGKDKGKTGSIVKILPKTGRVQIDGVNKKIRHIKARDGRPGERVEFFAPLEASNVAIQDPKTKKPTRIGYRIEKGQKVRVAKKSGTILETGRSIQSEKTKSIQA
jgi:large subunit ribosomal protein L24